MKLYRDWSPTPFDPAGAFTPEYHDWYVVPVIRTRDSGPFDESNFTAALALLGGETDPDEPDHAVTVLRCGHWGPGWFEIILVRTGSPAYLNAVEIERRLEDYPLLDEDDFSAREWEDANETWEHCYNVRDRVEMIQEYNARHAGYPISIFAARHPYIPQGDSGELFERCSGN